jgi:hypothetical protein
MARVALAVNDLPANGGGLNNLTFTAGDFTNDHEFANDGATLLVVKNTGVGAIVVTVASVADQFGRTKDTTLTVPAISGSDPGLAVSGFFLPAIWNQAGGKVFVDLPSATGLSLAVVRVPVTR